MKVVAPFEGKTEAQLKAVFVETMEFRKEVLKLPTLIDKGDHPELVIAGFSLKWPAWVMTPF